MPVKYKIELYQDKKKEWRWRIRNVGNSEIVGASSEGFVDRSDAEYNLKFVMEAIIEYTFS